jgi:hypothetical protein
VRFQKTQIMKATADPARRKIIEYSKSSVYFIGFVTAALRFVWSRFFKKKPLTIRVEKSIHKSFVRMRKAPPQRIRINFGALIGLRS